MPVEFPPGFAAALVRRLRNSAVFLRVVLLSVQVESQILVQKLSEQDNPYAIIASWVGPT